MVMNHGENTIRNCSSLQRPQEKQTATRSIPSIVFRNIQGFEGTALVNTEQYEAYGASQLGGSASGNKVKAMGDVPTIDIPIVVYATAK